jgi:hypothetical protein
MLNNGNGNGNGDLGGGGDYGRQLDGAWWGRGRYVVGMAGGKPSRPCRARACGRYVVRTARGETLPCEQIAATAYLCQIVPTLVGMDPNTSTFQHIFPVRAPLGTTFAGGTILLLPWGAAAFYGLLGTTGAGAPLLAVASEWPLIWVRTAAPLSKFERELLYLRRYSSDQAVATRGNHACGDVQPGDDPPDATVRTDDGRMGVESTSLTVEGSTVSSHNCAGVSRKPSPRSSRSSLAMSCMCGSRSPTSLGRPSCRTSGLTLRHLTR